jgi:hypothetical protein
MIQLVCRVAKPMTGCSAETQWFARRLVLLV